MQRLLLAMVVALTAPMALQPSSACAAPPSGTQSPDQRVTLNFDALPLQTVFALIAAETGRRLEMAPNVVGSGRFVYRDQPWRLVVEDIARRYGLQVREAPGVLRVSLR